MEPDRNRRGRRDRRAIVLSACFASSAFLFLAFFGVATTRAQQQARSPVTDQAAVERGKALHVEQCGFCHGANARGGSGGPDLTRSVLVLEDEGGKQLGAFLRVGRPDRGMPKFDMADAQMADLAAFLHSEIYLNSNRRLYKILDIVVGDPKAGQAYFNGAGGCNSCHSTTGDLKGVGAKYEPTVLQGRLLMPRGRPGGPGAPSGPLYLEKTAIKVTVTLPSGESASGGLVRLTDFDVILYDAAAGRVRSFLRNGDVPKVVVSDPLQAHVDHLTKWTDSEMHNMTAYLASLK
jgi:cytochrome c oxidase cbb3-type subunit III